MKIDVKDVEEYIKLAKLKRDANVRLHLLQKQLQERHDQVRIIQEITKQIEHLSNRLKVQTDRELINKIKELAK